MSGSGPFRVGLTGGIGSGKSTVARALAAAGFVVVDADRLVAELYRPGGAGAAAVRRVLGPDALAADGGVDHRRAATIVFADPAARRALEAAIHPLVRQAFADRVRAAGPHDVLVLEATLLVEAGYRPDFDLVVSVEADAALRVQRAVARGMSEADARARLAAQGEGEVRRAAADVILWNDGSVNELEAAVGDLARRIRAAAARRAAP